MRPRSSGLKFQELFLFVHTSNVLFNKKLFQEKRKTINIVIWVSFFQIIQAVENQRFGICWIVPKTQKFRVVILVVCPTRTANSGARQVRFRRLTCIWLAARTVIAAFVNLQSETSLGGIKVVDFRRLTFDIQTLAFSTHNPPQGFSKQQHLIFISSWKIFRVLHVCNLRCNNMQYF